MNMWPFNSKPKRPEWDQSAYLAKRHAEAEEKARAMPATHICEVNGVTHEACDTDGLLVSKTTGKVLGHNCGGVRVTGLLRSEHEAKLHDAMLGLLDKMLASDVADVSFNSRSGCSGGWMTSATFGGRKYEVSFYRGWRWLDMEKEVSVELTTDEYDSLEKRLEARVAPATMDDVMRLGE